MKCYGGEKVRNKKITAIAKLNITIVFFIVTLCMFVTVAFAWFAINDDIKNPAFNMITVDKAFTMGDFKIIADGEDMSVNEFSGLLPGSVFKFELLINRKVEGDLRLKLEIKGLSGDSFIGKTDKLEHNMTELFCVAPLDANDVVVGEEVYFDTNVNGTLLLFSNVSLPSTEESVTLKFQIKFSADKVGMQQLSNAINRLKFNIGSMYVSLI